MTLHTALSFVKRFEIHSSSLVVTCGVSQQGQGLTLNNVCNMTFAAHLFVSCQAFLFFLKTGNPAMNIQGYNF